METLGSELLNLSQRHSIFGIVSSTIGALSVLMLCGGFVALVLTSSSIAHFQQSDTMQQLNTTAFITMLCGAPLSFIGAGLGVAGFFESNTQRPFVILGMIINGAVLLVYFCVLMVIVIEYS